MELAGNNARQRINTWNTTNNNGNHRLKRKQENNEIGRRHRKERRTTLETKYTGSKRMEKIRTSLSTVNELKDKEKDESRSWEINYL